MKYWEADTPQAYVVFLCPLSLIISSHDNKWTIVSELFSRFGELFYIIIAFEMGIRETCNSELISQKYEVSGTCKWGKSCWTEPLTCGVGANFE